MLAARFHALRDRTIAQVDRVLAEPVRLSPMRDGVADTSRQQIVIEAVLRAGAGKDMSVSGGRDRDWRSEYNAQAATLSIDRAAYPDLVVRDGDKVRALARPGEPVFVVASVDSRAAHRMVVNLGEA